MGKSWKSAKMSGNLASEGRAYGNLGKVYHVLPHFEEAIKWHEEEAKIANEIGNRAAQGFETRNLGYAYHSLNSFIKQTSFTRRRSRFAENKTKTLRGKSH